MTLTIKHAKTNNIAAWTQADLDAQIALGNFPPGTLLADITLSTDWNSNHTITGTLDPTQNNVSVDGSTITGDGTPGNPLISHATGGASSVSNADGTLTISPTTGAVVASINLANSNIWTAPQIISSNSANAFDVGANGSTNPAFKVDASATSAATGLSVISGTAGGGVMLAAISSGTNEAFTIRSLGTGNLNLTSSGSVNIRSNNYISSAGQNSFAAGASSNAATIPFLVTSPAVTGMSAGTDHTISLFEHSATIQHLSNTAVSNEYGLRITAPTYGFVTAGGTITNASSVYISGSPIAGTNATITNPFALNIAGGNVAISTVTSGVWNGTAINEIHGGTNQTTYTAGDILYASASNTLSKLPIGSSTNVLTVVGGVPAWAAGGSSPLTTKGDLYGFDTANARVPVGTDGQVLTADSTQALGVKYATPATVSNKQLYTSPTNFTPGTTTTLTLTTSPIPSGASAIEIFYNGIYQNSDQWSYNSGTGVITFTAAIPVGVTAVEAKWGSGSAGGVASVSNVDGTLTISPTTGAVIASINLANSNAWTAAQTIQSTSATAFAVGANGATNPIIKINANTASVATGIQLTGAAAGSGMAISTLSSGANEALNISSKGSSDLQLSGGTGGNIVLQPSGTTRYTYSATNITLTPTTLATAATVRWLYTAAGDTGLTAGTEAPCIKFDLSASRQHASNTTITTQRDFWIRPTTHTFATATGTITTASTLYIEGAPIAGSNAAITNPFALNVASGATNLAGATTIGGTLAMGSQNITMTGSLAATGARVTKGWFTDIESTNVPTVGGVALPTASSTTTFTNKRITKRVSALSANSATPAVNTDNFDVLHITAQTATITGITVTGTPADGDTLRISITGTASVPFTMGTSFEASTVAVPTTTSSTARLDIGCIWNTETSKWRVVAVA